MSSKQENCSPPRSKCKSLTVTGAPSKPRQSYVSRRKIKSSSFFTPKQSIITVQKRRGRPPVIIGITDAEASPHTLNWYHCIETHAEFRVDPPNFQDIYHYFKHMEIMAKYRPLDNYIETVQKDLTADMRAKVIDRLAYFTRERGLSTDTLCRSVSYIDRFLSYNLISHEKLSLLAFSALRLASHYDEHGPPLLIQFSYITQPPTCIFNDKEVMDMQNEVFKCFNYEIGNPTVNTFVGIFVRDESDDSFDWQLEFMGCYLAELSLLDYTLIKFLPSIVAASVVFVARFALHPNEHPWSKRMQELTGYKVSSLKDCISSIHDLHISHGGPSLAAIKVKYQQLMFQRVATINPPSKIPTIYLEDISE